jgi:hypothetical protein
MGWGLMRQAAGNIEAIIRPALLNSPDAFASIETQSSLGKNKILGRSVPNVRKYVFNIYLERVFGAIADRFGPLSF